MSDVRITDDGVVWYAQMIARIGSVAAAAANGDNGTITATSGGAYRAMVDQTYIITVKVGGGAGVATLTIVGSEGDSADDVSVTGENAEIAVGSFGSTISFDFGEDNELTVGYAWTIVCEGIDEIKYCAIGSGDETFVDPENPPEEIATPGSVLKNEFARVHYHQKCYLVEDELGIYSDGTIRYSISSVPTGVTAYFFLFDKFQGEAETIKEWGIFADDAGLKVAGQYGEHGLYNAGTNPDGEVLTLGTMIAVKNIPDYSWKKDHPGQCELPIIFISTA
jgi:hypothetical protein